MTPGTEGDAVRDLQRRLAAAGFGDGDLDGCYGDATRLAVRAFQRVRGLRDDGVCDHYTWSALVEANWQLGDRLLYQRAPNLRGDDVADLQGRLGSLGFDAGRVDGIFGPATAQALQEFQRNVGLPVDGICGFETVQALHRLGGRESGQSVATVREAEHLRHSTPTLAGKRIVVGHEGGLGALARAIGRSLRHEGATVIVVDEPEGSGQATAANRFGADVFLGLAAASEEGFIAYYGVPQFESVGGRRLAGLLADAMDDRLGWHLDARGMRLPALRETRMPAVVCEVPAQRAVLDASAQVSEAVTAAVTAWVQPLP